MRSWLRRKAGWVLGLLAVLLGIWALLPGSSLTYLGVQGWYQLEILRARVPIRESLERPDLDPVVSRKLRWVLEIRDYAEQDLGFTPTGNYSAWSPTFRREIFQVSACPPLEFKPHLWWFPIVGSLPYKGFFRKSDALQEEQRLQDLGLETRLSGVGGYSTLGWFEDPLLPFMLDLEEAPLAGLILHELAHATLYIPGNADFNENFAAFVGEEAAVRLLEKKYGAGAAEGKAYRAGLEAGEGRRALMHRLYTRLEEIYQGGGTAQEKRLARRAALEQAQRELDADPVLSAGVSAGRILRMNNADLLQYRRYGAWRARFAEALERSGGDMRAFFDAFRAGIAGGESGEAVLSRLSGGGAAGSRER